MRTNPRLSSIIDRLLLKPTLPASIKLVIGEAVEFSDEQIIAQWGETPLANIPLTIRRVPVEQQCMVCFAKYRPSRAEVLCPYCGSVGAKIIAGMEFYLESTEA